MVVVVVVAVAEVLNREKRQKTIEFWGITEFEEFQWRN